MAEAVAGLLVSTLVSIAKDKLGSAVREQASLLWNFGDHLEEMKDHLETISAVLNDAERQSTEKELVRLWLKRLKNAALDIADMLEDYQDASDQANAKMPGLLSYLPVTFKNIPVANRIKSLTEKLRKIKEEIAIFGFEKGSSTNTEQPYNWRETMSYLPEEPVVGRDEEKQEIINMLSANTSNDHEIVIVAIYGLGGMGKSTLAQLVYNDAQFKKYDYRIWVYVSQDFDLSKIGSYIISQLPTQDGQQNLGTQQAIKHQLDKLLHGKTVLVVLDDLWEEKMTELAKLRVMLHVKGSKVDVIVTTRKKEIAIEVSTNQAFKLQSLEVDKCWEIIKRYSKFEHKFNKEKMEQVGLEISKKCGGVPLAAQAIGFMLRSIDDMSEWIEINNSSIWSGSSKASDVLPSLKLSYERMPTKLRICFSYCAIFPKGHTIIQDDLIQQWNALDFIEQSEGKECINKLLGMSFLQVSKLPSTSQKHVVRYTMHDLVHDLARLTAADELIVFDVAPPKNTRDHKYCRYSVLRRYDQTMKLAYMPTKLKALRLSGSGDLDFPCGAFSFAKYLRTLDFSECSGILLPASIGRMKQLRCLIAPRMKNNSLPKFITKLSKLQYLNINGSSQISEIPESIGNLVCLNHLCLSDCFRISKMPKSFSDMKCMVHLEMSGCSRLKELPDSVGNLTHLRHLELSGCASVKALPQSMCGLTQLQYLNLSSCYSLEGIPEGIGSLVVLHHLNMSHCYEIRELPESLMKLQSLSHLNLKGCGGGRMRRGSLACLRGLTALQHLDISSSPEHEFDFIVNLTNLEHLGLSCNHELTYLPESIGNLKRLDTLDIGYCSKLKSLPDSIGTLGLKSLLVNGCCDELMEQASLLVNYSQMLPMFKVRADGGVNSGSNLHLLKGVHVSELEICCLENVRSLEEANNVNLSEKHNLSVLRLAWSSEREVQYLEDKDLMEQLVPPRGLKSMWLEGYSSTSFPGWLKDISRHLTNLVFIQLNNMPTCSNLPPLGQLPHLERLSIGSLPAIKRIDREFCGGKGAFRRLSSFCIIFMEGLEEWNTTYSVEDGVEDFMFPVLDRLDIFSCPRLRLKPCPPTFRACCIRWSDQVIASMEEVGKTVHQSFSSSRAIELTLDIPGVSSLSIGLFEHFPSLEDLTIYGHDLNSVPESIRHLTSLQSLVLSGLHGVSALPEWLGELSSLKSLTFGSCNSIKSLPSSIQQLKNLQTLNISDCPELKKWYESEENKSKLAQIGVDVSVSSVHAELHFIKFQPNVSPYGRFDSPRNRNDWE